MINHLVKKLTALALVLFVLTACARTEPERTMVTPTGASTEAPGDAQSGNGPTQEATFALTAEEKTLYETYVKDIDVSIFKDVPPVSIAKVFIQCGMEGNVPAEYNLYAPSSVDITLEQYIQETTEEATALPLDQRQYFADSLFGLLDKGKFVETSDTTGHIEFVTSLGEASKFQFVKNSDGIWLVRFELLGD